MKLSVVLLLIVVAAIVATEARKQYRYGGRRYYRTRHYKPNYRPHYPNHRPCRYRKVNCKVYSWHQWSSCSDPCGNAGTRHRVRYIKQNPLCEGKACPSLQEKQPCNRFCKNGGTPRHGYCSCRQGYKGKCCQIAPPPHQHCHWSGWGAWCKCSATCGCGTRTRARTCKCEQYGHYGYKRHYDHCQGINKQQQKCNCKNCYGPSTKYVYVGCFKDKNKPNRVLPNFIAKIHGHTTPAQEISLCAHAAEKLNVGYFGMQDGGECWVDKTRHNHYDRWGVATNCKNGLGGGWANSVYRMI